MSRRDDSEIVEVKISSTADIWGIKKIFLFLRNSGISRKANLGADGFEFGPLTQDPFQGQRIRLRRRLAVGCEKDRYREVKTVEGMMNARSPFMSRIIHQVLCRHFTCAAPHKPWGLQVIVVTLGCRHCWPRCKDGKTEARERAQLAQSQKGGQAL